MYAHILKTSAGATKAWLTRQRKAQEAKDAKSGPPTDAAPAKAAPKTVAKPKAAPVKVAPAKQASATSQVPKFASIDAASDWAMNTHGIDIDYQTFKASLAGAQHFSEVLDRNVNLGVKFPTTMLGCTKKGMQTLGLDPVDTMAMFVPDVNKAKSFMVVNLDHKAMKSSKALVKEMEENEGWLASKDPDHIFRHEAGHYAHSMEHSGYVKDAKSTMKFGKGEKALISEYVSEYAAQEPLELVAEVYAGNKAGKAYPKEIMDIYARYKGPKLGAVTAEPVKMNPKGKKRGPRNLAEALDQAFKADVKPYLSQAEMLKIAESIARKHILSNP